VPVDAHAIYLLNLLLAFLQPKFDPSLQDDLMADELEGGEGDTPSPLPSNRDDEFRPFVRRLPEWQFWYFLLSHAYSWQQLSTHCHVYRLSTTRATLIAFFMTFSIRVRCPSVLANPRDVLLRLVCVDHEKAITVSWYLFF
jgi:hypothetical protein